MQRGNNKQCCFHDDQDRFAYLKRVADCLEETAVLLHAYVLMGNHIHLLITPTEDTAAGLFMKRLGQRYTQYFNGRYKRSGTLWEGRYKSSLIETQRYLLICYRYIELNPVRAQLTEQPGQYQWSSYQHNALGASNPLITAHDEYLALGANAKARTNHYRKLFCDKPIDEVTKLHIAERLDRCASC
jgi:putative transposase